MERPSRKTKAVNYCEAKDFDDDEDFACVKAPASKKPREDGARRRERHAPSSAAQSQEFNSQAALTANGRRPLDERLHKRDLEAAITLSLLNTADEATEPTPAGEGDIRLHLPADENTDPSSRRASNCSVDSSLLGLDEITEEAESRKRKACKATEDKKKLKDEDEDYRPKPTPGSESDGDFSEQDDSEDEEFTVKKANKAPKKEKRTKNGKPAAKPAAVAKKEKQPAKPSKPKSQHAAASTPVRTPTAKVTSEPRRPAAATCRPAVSPSPAGGRVPKWNPPGQIGKGPASPQTPAGRSPGQGLRLGLSRRVRVKPLHPSVASH